MEKVHVKLIKNIWMTAWDNKEVVKLFGTNVLPTAYNSNMSGNDVVKNLKSNPKNKDCEFILVT